MDIITLEEYKVANAMTADPKKDAEIAFLITAVSNLIKAYIGLDLDGGKTVKEVVLVDYETDTIFLGEYPVESIISINETSPRYTTDSTVHVPLTGNIDYVADLANGIITRIVGPGGFARWPLDPGYITVEYTTAPDIDIITDGIPADLKLAAVMLVNHYRNEDFRQTKSVQGTSIVNNMASAGYDFPKHIQVILDRYK